MSMCKVVYVIPEELGGVSHARNYILVDHRVADALATYSTPERLSRVKSMIGQENFESARVFCKAVKDLTKTGVGMDAAVARVVGENPL